MNPTHLLYAVGVVVEGWLSVVLFVAWRALRESGVRWPLWLGVAFLLNAVRMGLLASGRGDVALAQPAWYLTSLLGEASVVLLTRGLIEEAGVRGPAARWLLVAAAVLAALVYATGVAGVINRGRALEWVSLFFVLWMVLFIRAAWREPGSGHGFVVLALSTFPVGGIALRLGWMPRELLPINELVPVTALGLSALVTGLVRAHRQAQRESALASRALAARELAEAQLRAANETLELRVNQRTRELRETIEGLESFNRIVSHDLRGPLGGIAGVAQLAREEVASGRAAQAQHMLAAIERQAASSIRMVGALLALARAGSAQPRRQAVDSAALVAEVVEGLRGLPPPEAQRRPPAIELGVLPTVDADPELLRQVFVNLIGNAIKFSGATAAPRIEVGARAGGDAVVFHVRDNGVGFSPDDEARLFKPFERLHGTHFEGFGVGLTIVRRIVEHHGGRIWAESEPGRGACFHFTLQQDTPSPAPAAPGWPTAAG